MPATVHRLSEPDPIEIRLQVVIELLDKAAQEVSRVVAEINDERREPSTDPGRKL